MAEAFSFELVSPERLLLSEEVQSVVLPGSDGEFEVLARHAPFLSTLRPGIMRVNGTTRGERRIFVRGGFADVNRTGLTVLAEEAIPMEDLDREALATRIRDAEEDVADLEDPAERDDAERRLQHLRDVQEALGHA